MKATYSGKTFFGRAGLQLIIISELEAARLLLPDTKDGRYRPKLAGWGKKLAYLMGEGWTVDEMKQWSKRRWTAPDPLAWPPKKYGWK